MEVAISGKITGQFAPTQFHLLLLGSLASLWTWGYLAVNVGTSKQTGGDRVSTISLLGCSTSVALATGPTDEEEEEEAAHTDKQEQSLCYCYVTKNYGMAIACTAKNEVN